MSLAIVKHDENLPEIFNDISNLTKPELQDLIHRLETNLSAVEQLDVPIKHYFSKDVYAREMFTPAGSIIIGKIHKYQNLNILSSGKISVLSIDGVATVEAPFTFVASPGAKRVFYVHEDATWTVIHGTNETDVEKIEETFIAKSYDEVYLASNRTLDDVLLALGATIEQLNAISNNEIDQIPFSEEVDVTVGPSCIHDKGLIALKDFSTGEMICRARIEGKRTPAGRYANHSSTPNAEMIMDINGDVRLIAIKSIELNQEITTDYYMNHINTRNTKCLG